MGHLRVTNHRSPITARCVGLLIAISSPPLYAQAPLKHLSDWLLQRPASIDAYPLGLSWQVPEEMPAQNALRLGLLKSLAGFDRDVKAEPEAMGRLRVWLSTLPITGRVPVALPDGWWLQANPTRDPVLLPEHNVVLPLRPSTLTVITEQGMRCAVTHAPGREARDYLQACNPLDAVRTDWVWVAQPDGRVQRYGVAAWNREVQDVPAPGSWIWGPPRDSGWPASFSQRLIAFLATQGPAADPVACNANSPPKPDYDSSLMRQGGAAAGFGMPSLSATAQGPAEPTCEGTSAGSNRHEIATHPSGTTPLRSRSAEISASDWGYVGLLQTPTARMNKSGHFSFNYSRTLPYTNGNIFVQPLDWLEAGFRYTDVANRASDLQQFFGGESYKDKSVDIKFRLWSESAYLPQIAVGLRDIGGSGLFSGEYLVANKRLGALDWSLGLGWGYLGARGSLRNPLSLFSSSFNTRNGPNTTEEAGNFSFGNYFRGPTALFGGVQYQTPWERLIVKLEYEGNDYQHEPQANNQRQSSPWNFGLVYRAGPALDLTAGIERGNTLTLGLALRTQLDGLSMPKVGDPPRVPVAATRPQQEPDWAATSREIVRQTSWDIGRIEQNGSELRLGIEDAGSITYWRERVDRASAVLHRDAPASVDRFTFRYRERGIETAEHVVDRDAWVVKQTQPVPPSEQRESVIARAPEPTTPLAPLYTNSRPRFESGFRTGFTQTLGGPDAYLLYQIYAEESAKFRIRDDTWLQGSLHLRLVDNYDKFKFTAPSNLPRVRTYLREYLTTSEITMPNLQFTHVGRLSENQYYSVYGGYLEEAFAGVGGEWLYRPFASRFAFGVDVNEVKQRNFRQNFNFRNAGDQTGYRTTTGHGRLYWDTGWQDVQALVSVGRYLAKDVGATVQLSRVFKNGVSVGAFATITSASKEQFGEGSFDKGVFIRLPFDAILPKSTNAAGTIVWKPLTRDGGAILSRANSLYGITNARNDRALTFEPAPRPNEELIPSDYRELSQPKAAVSEPYTRITPKPLVAKTEQGPHQDYPLMEALYRQKFRNIRIDYDGSKRLTIALANNNVYPVSRAVGRAARTALRLAPLDAREIRIVYAQRTDPVVTYDFLDLQRLDRYFNGTLKESDLATYVAVDYLNPAAREQNPLAYLDDLESPGEQPILAGVLPETFSVNRVAGDIAGAARTTADTNWLWPGVIGAGLVLGSSALDNRGSQFAKDHADSRWLKNEIRLGNALPYLGLAGSALLAFDGSDPRRSRTAYAATEAGGVAVLAATGLKYVVGRARPNQELGNHKFDFFSSSQDSFPSRHTMTAWAVATPFALEYDAPWLYGVAALTNLARVGSREHWLSDTVASSLLGYGLGRVFWESSRTPGRDVPRVLLERTGIKLSWDY